MFTSGKLLILSGLLLRQLVYGDISFLTSGIPPDARSMTRCSEEQQKIIIVEAKYASKYAEAAGDNFSANDYYMRFFPPSLYENTNWGAEIAKKYKTLRTIPQAKSRKMSGSCDNSTPNCQQGSVAHVPRGLNHINLCAKFFNKESTDKFLESMQDPNSASKKFLTLDRFKMLRSSTVLHEETHMAFGFYDGNFPKITLDYAYGVEQCLALAEGTLNLKREEHRPSSTILCPEMQWQDAAKTIPILDSKGEQVIAEGLCDSENAGRNADTLSFVAMGIYYSKRFDKYVPVDKQDHQKTFPDLVSQWEEQEAALHKAAAAAKESGINYEEYIMPQRYVGPGEWVLDSNNGLMFWHEFESS